ncbi:MAG: hypothetical protein LBP85_06720, partial [Prevotellaceae bacterium]|nr:hypothetical protein [Prevotellaceae bacterium]
MHFFDSKLVGDLIQRINDHERIESFLTRTVLNSLFSVLTIFVFGIILFLYNVKIFAIMLVGSVLYVIWISLFMKKRAELDHKNFAVMATYESDIIELIQGMQEIKLTGSEQQKRWRWESVQANIFRIKLQSLSLEQWQHVGSVFINETKNILITILSAASVINGDITLGSVEINLTNAEIVLATILRAGLPLHQGMLNIFDKAENAFVSAYRKYDRDNSFKVKIEYISSPSLDNKTLIISDPMLATGASMHLVYRSLIENGIPEHTHIVSIIASKEG